MIDSTHLLPLLTRWSRRPLPAGFVDKGGANRQQRREVKYGGRWYSTRRSMKEALSKVAPYKRSGGGVRAVKRKTPTSTHSQEHLFYSRRSSCGRRCPGRSRASCHSLSARPLMMAALASVRVPPPGICCGRFGTCRCSCCSSSSC